MSRGHAPSSDTDTALYIIDPAIQQEIAEIQQAIADAEHLTRKIQQVFVFYKPLAVGTYAEGSDQQKLAETLKNIYAFCQEPLASTSAWMYNTRDRETMVATLTAWHSQYLECAQALALAQLTEPKQPKQPKQLFFFKVIRKEDWPNFLLDLIFSATVRNEKRDLLARKDFTVRLKLDNRDGQYYYEVIPTNKEDPSRSPKLDDDEKASHTRHQAVTAGAHNIGDDILGFYPPYFEQTCYNSGKAIVGIIFHSDALSVIPLNLIGIYEGGTYHRKKDFNLKTHAWKTIFEKIREDVWFTSPEALIASEVRKKTSRLNELLAYLTIHNPLAINNFSIMIFENNEESRLVASIRAAEFAANYCIYTGCKEHRVIPICFYDNTFGTSVCTSKGGGFKPFPVDEQSALLRRHPAWGFVHAFLNSLPDLPPEQNFTAHSVFSSFPLQDDQFIRQVKKILSEHCNHQLLKKFDNGMKTPDLRIIKTKNSELSHRAKPTQVMGVNYRFQRAADFSDHTFSVSEMLRSISRKATRAIIVNAACVGQATATDQQAWELAKEISTVFLEKFGALEDQHQFLHSFECDILEETLMSVANAPESGCAELEERRLEFLSIFLDCRVFCEKMIPQFSQGIAVKRRTISLEANAIKTMVLLIAQLDHWKESSAGGTSVDSAIELLWLAIHCMFNNPSEDTVDALKKQVQTQNKYLKTFDQERGLQLRVCFDKVINYVQDANRWIPTIEEVKGSLSESALGLFTEKEGTFNQHAHQQTDTPTCDTFMLRPRQAEIMREICNCLRIRCNAVLECFCAQLRAQLQAQLLSQPLLTNNFMALTQDVLLEHLKIVAPFRFHDPDVLACPDGFTFLSAIDRKREGKASTILSIRQDTLLHDVKNAKLFVYNLLILSHCHLIPGVVQLLDVFGSYTPQVECPKPPESVSQLLDPASSASRAVNSPTVAAAGAVSVPENRDPFPGERDESFSGGFGHPSANRNQPSKIFFVVTEEDPTKNLNKLLCDTRRKKSILSISIVRPLLWELLITLKELKNLNIVHANLAPENILLSPLNDSGRYTSHLTNPLPPSDVLQHCTVEEKWRIMTSFVTQSFYTAPEVMQSEFDELFLMQDDPAATLTQGRIYIGQKNGYLTYSLITLNGETLENQETKIPTPENFTLEELQPLKNLILQVALKVGHIVPRNDKTDMWTLGCLIYELLGDHPLCAARAPSELWGVIETTPNALKIYYAMRLLANKKLFSRDDETCMKQILAPFIYDANSSIYDKVISCISHGVDRWLSDTKLRSLRGTECIKFTSEKLQSGKYVRKHILCCIQRFVRYHTPFPALSCDEENLISLMMQMVRLSPTERISIDDALAHAFFEPMRKDQSVNLPSSDSATATAAAPLVTQNSLKQKIFAELTLNSASNSASPLSVIGAFIMLTVHAAAQKVAAEKRTIAPFAQTVMDMLLPKATKATDFNPARFFQEQNQKMFGGLGLDMPQADKWLYGPTLRSLP